LRLVRATLALGDSVGAEGVLNAVRAANLPFTKLLEDEERKMNQLKTLRNEMRVLKEKKDFRTVSSIMK